MAVLKKLINVFSEDAEGLLRTFWWLGEKNVIAYIEQHPPLEESTSGTRTSLDECIKSFAEQTVSQTKKIEGENRDFPRTIHRLRIQMDKFKRLTPKKQLKELGIKLHLAGYGRLGALAQCWTKEVPRSTKVAIQRFVNSERYFESDDNGINSSSSGSAAVSSASSAEAILPAISLEAYFYGTLAAAPLVNVFSMPATCNTIAQWLKGKMSGADCAQDIIARSLGSPTDAGNALDSVVLGYHFGPFGELIGKHSGPAAADGGSISSSLAKLAATFRRIIEDVFVERTASVALENALSFVCLPADASLGLRTSALPQLLRTVRLQGTESGGDGGDGSGSDADFFRLNAYLGIITASQQAIDLKSLDKV